MRLPKPVKKTKKRKPLSRIRVPRPGGLLGFWEKVKEADELARKIVRARNIGGLCKRCRVKKAQDVHHLRDRRLFPVRWDLRNLVHLCRGCHYIVGWDSEANRELAVRILGEGTWSELVLRSRIEQKTDPSLAIVALNNEPLPILDTIDTRQIIHD